MRQAELGDLDTVLRRDACEYISEPRNAIVGILGFSVEDRCVGSYRTIDE